MRILVVDDEEGIRALLTRMLTMEGHDVMTASDGVEALALLENVHTDLVLSDVRMPRMDGLELLRRHLERGTHAPFVIMSAYGDDDAAVEAIRRGAHDYLSKPFRAEHVLLVLRKALEREKLRSSVRILNEELSLVRGEEDVIGRSSALRNAVMLARKVAPHSTSVLITGESGTGKETIARLIHRSSPRFDKPFVAVDCGALPDSLLEVELFGESGAEHGARVGLVDDAVGGTLFLGDVEHLCARLQIRLLAALRRARKKDPASAITALDDIRVIAAAAGDLEAEVAAGRFRPDLFYEISVMRLHLPPLRDREEDVPDLALYFAGSYSRKLQRPTPRITPAALRALSEHGWPGNVTELENAVERALIMGEGDEVRLEHVEIVLHGKSARDGASGEEEDLSIKRHTAALEKKLIAIALDRTGGNRSRAAKILDLSHRALLYKIRDYGLGQ